MAAEGDDQEVEFDFDAHIRRLMGEVDDDDEEDDDDDDLPSLGDDEHGATNEQQQLVQEQFDQALAEQYDEEEIGELDEFDERLQGHMEMDNKLLDTALEDYLQSACKIEYSEALGWKKEGGEQSKDAEVGDEIDSNCERRSFIPSVVAGFSGK